MHSLDGIESSKRALTIRPGLKKTEGGKVNYNLHHWFPTLLEAFVLFTNYKISGTTDGGRNSVEGDVSVDPYRVHQCRQVLHVLQCSPAPHRRCRACSALLTCRRAATATAAATIEAAEGGRVRGYRAQTCRQNSIGDFDDVSAWRRVEGEEDVLHFTVPSLQCNDHFTNCYAIYRDWTTARISLSRCTRNTFITVWSFDRVRIVRAGDLGSCILSVLLGPPSGVTTSHLTDVAQIVTNLNMQHRTGEKSESIDEKNTAVNILRGDSYTVLYCTVLHCTVLYCTVPHCTVLHCTVLHCTVLYCTVLYSDSPSDHSEGFHRPLEQAALCPAHRAFAPHTAHQGEGTL